MRRTLHTYSPNGVKTNKHYFGLQDVKMIFFIFFCKNKMFKVIGLYFEGDIKQNPKKFWYTPDYSTFSAKAKVYEGAQFNQSSRREPIRTSANEGTVCHVMEELFAFFEKECTDKCIISTYDNDKERLTKLMSYCDVKEKSGIKYTEVPTNDLHYRFDFSDLLSKQIYITTIPNYIYPNPDSCIKEKTTSIESVLALHANNYFNNRFTASNSI